MEQPKSMTFGIVLTALEPISHHDPRTGGDGNTLTFLRMPQVVRLKFADAPVWQHLLDRLCAQNPMPRSIAELTERLGLAEFLAVAYVRLFIDIYNNAAGTGLFSGMGRYEMLDRRLETSAVKSGSLHSLWDVLTGSLDLGIHPERFDAALGSFFTLPPSVQHQVLTAMANNHRSIVSVARIWHATNKQQSEEYVAATGGAFAPEDMITPDYSVQGLAKTPDVAILNLPAISANGVRHQLVRGPGWRDLAQRLGFASEYAGEGPLEQAVETLFDNGGNIKSGATMPNVPLEQVVAMFANGGFKESGSSERAQGFYLAAQIRKAYPLLDLVGGVCNAFDLGESRLKVGTWLICRENADALPPQVAALETAQLSAFDFLSEITRTRQAVMDRGQMIYNYEVLIKGAQVYTEFSLAPFTPELTRGALVSALDFYQEQEHVLAGQGARGHGKVDLAWANEPDLVARDHYRDYLALNRHDLHAWLLDGSLGTGVPWVVR